MRRTTNIELLLRVSKSLDSNDTAFKRKLYNELLSRIRFIDTNNVNEMEQHQIANEIIENIGKYYSLHKRYYKMKTRKRAFVKARHSAIYLIWINTRLSTQVIGSKFNRNHSTVLHAKKSVSNLCETDKVFKLELQNIAEKLGLKY